MIAGPLGPILVALGVRAGLNVAVSLVDGISAAVVRGAAGLPARGAGTTGPGFATALDAARAPGAVVAAARGAPPAPAVRQLALDARARAVALDPEAVPSGSADRRREAGRALAAYRRLAPVDPS
jgi:hypothetical protein